MSQLKSSNIINYVYNKIEIVGDIDKAAFINGNSFGFTVATFNVGYEFSPKSVILETLKDTDLDSIVSILSEFFDSYSRYSCDENLMRPSFYTEECIPYNTDKSQFVSSILITKVKDCDCSWVEFFIEPDQIPEAAYHNSFEDCIEHMFVFFVPSSDTCYR